MSKEAWVTVVTNDTYGLGALVLGSSLRRVGTTRDTVVMVTPGVSDRMREELSRVFTSVVPVDVLDSGDSANLALLARPELGVTFTKLHVWTLVQYSKCVFLDADTLVIQNCDELFEREELSAVPDPGWPDCFNSGVFVFVPSLVTYQALLDFAVAHGSFDGGDQGLLNMFFREWATQDIRKHLSFIYNLVASTAYTYLPALKFFGSQVKIVHFLGSNKPWTRQSEASSSPYQRAWWSVFREDVGSHLSQEMTGVAGALARGDTDEWRKEAWEAGDVDYLGRDSFDNIWKRICECVGISTQPTAPTAAVTEQSAKVESQIKSTAPSQVEAATKEIVQPATGDKQESEKVLIPEKPLSEEPASQAVPAPTTPTAQPGTPVDVPAQPPVPLTESVPQPEALPTAPAETPVAKEIVAQIESVPPTAPSSQPEAGSGVQEPKTTPSEVLPTPDTAKEIPAATPAEPPTAAPASPTLVTATTELPIQAVPPPAPVSESPALPPLVPTGTPAPVPLPSEASVAAPVIPEVPTPVAAPVTAEVPAPLTPEVPAAVAAPLTAEVPAAVAAPLAAEPPAAVAAPVAAEVPVAPSTQIPTPPAAKEITKPPGSTELPGTPETIAAPAEGPVVSPPAPLEEPPVVTPAPAESKVEPPVPAPEKEPTSLEPSPVEAPPKPPVATEKAEKEVKQDTSVPPVSPEESKKSDTPIQPEKVDAQAPAAETSKVPEVISDKPEASVKPIAPPATEKLEETTKPSEPAAPVCTKPMKPEKKPKETPKLPMSTSETPLLPEAPKVDSPAVCPREPGTPTVTPASGPGSPVAADPAPEVCKLQAAPSQPSTPPAASSQQTEPPVPPKRKQGKNGKPGKGGKK